jgi:hypothetical protein
MRTPAGSECPHYYEDYFRGRNLQECRLIPPGKGRHAWSPGLCAHCPVPGVYRANACPNLVLEARIESRLLSLSRRVRLSAYCTRAKAPVAEPEIGCGHCHELVPLVQPPEDQP